MTAFGIPRFYLYLKQKMTTLLFLIVFSIFNLNPAIARATTTCEVVAFYELATTEPGTKVLTNQGNVEEVNLLLKPVRLDEGAYDIEITRKAPNLYQILSCPQNSKIATNKYYLETRYCHEFANYSKAVLKVEGNFGVVKGKITFN